MSKKNRAFVHCDKYTTDSLFVTKHKPTHKDNLVDDLKPMEEDCEAFSICKYKNFEKGHNSKTLCLGLTQIMLCTFTLHRVHVRHI